MRRAARAVLRVPVLAVLLALAAGCGAVRMEPPEPDARTAGLCRTMMARLPDTLYGQDRVPVVPDSDLVAAWGSPTIAVRCGVERPAGLRPESQLLSVNDIPWLPEPAASPTLFTAVGREAYVELTLPATYTPSAVALTTLSELIEEEIPALPPGRL
ncbi:DUF3515 domain-containing protein [Thermobifida alba]|uniref:DUF3515 domain-containing protein n=1 Tax=Thermobifida alba TaxID=53522 RepID=A0ABY4L660_THEAE|nr:DUF3515 domain-containing protein [Thermobifida alba]UPT23134.1 DUF3515 domain-containing protein [Thermobifida alba]